MNSVPRLLVILLFVLVPAAMGSADIRSKAARETAEFLMRRFGKEATRHGVNALTHKLEILASRHGPEALTAVRKVGPSALPLIEQAGEHGPQAVRVLAHFGEEGIAIVSRPQSMTLVAKLGDEAATALVRHPGIAEPLLEAHGLAALRALKVLKSPNGRRLAMMLQNGELHAIGRTGELLEVIGLYGERAMDFIWRHKGALAITAVLAAFLADPGTFIQGVRDITKVVGDATVRPLAEVPGKVAQEAARGTNWTLLGVVALGLLAGVLLMRHYHKRRK